MDNQKFLRFPGGSDIEGLLSPYWYKWNDTVGPLKDRVSRPSAWGYEESNGIGLIEYMNWCDDFKLEPSGSSLVLWADPDISNYSISSPRCLGWSLLVRRSHQRR